MLFRTPPTTRCVDGRRDCYERARERVLRGALVVLGGKDGFGGTIEGDAGEGYDGGWSGWWVRWGLGWLD